MEDFKNRGKTVSEATVIGKNNKKYWNRSKNSYWNNNNINNEY